MSTERRRLMVIVSSTRPSRVGHKIGAWIVGRAEAHSGFDIDLVDLVELDLPFLDEPKHPRFADYSHDHTKDWSSRVDLADAFVFVMAEYNHSFTAPIKNAVDFLSREWAYKPVGYVGYGGVAGGTRAVQAIKPVCIAVRMVPLFDSVYIPWIAQQIDEDGAFISTEALEASANVMFDELLKVSEALWPLRRPAPTP
ncbi:MAG TPA: NADPH-dependent FMN reductase [Ilumatobacteraceae bacterium]|nr:NADPH-dependent FMN reductase [Ilumatobacteraceae bacterium]